MSHALKQSEEVEPSPDGLLREGDTVWRRLPADRAAMLIDGASYYGALREALLQARHSVFIVGWDIDSRTRIVGASGAADDGAPEELGDLLSHLAGERADLDIYVLPWDYSLLFLRERELLPMVALGWRTPERVHVCVDGTAPVGSSHHQKLVVIDDALAFCGGLDLTLRRWDTRDHDNHNPARVDPAGTPYGPYHDVQMLVDGEAAAALGLLARARWKAASGRDPKPAAGYVPPPSPDDRRAATRAPAAGYVPPPSPDDRRAATRAPAADARCPWPRTVEPDFENVHIGIARTEPQAPDGHGIQEVERLTYCAIAAAERTIYIENQYLNCDAIAEALVERAEAAPELEIVIVSNQDSGGWIEERTMGVGRRRFIAILMDSPAADRIRVLRATVGRGEARQEVHIHAKLLFVDDRLLRVGSANINQRSMGVDTECDLAIEACDDAERSRILRLRDRMVAHHLGIPTARLREAIERHDGSLIAALEAAGSARPPSSEDRRATKRAPDTSKRGEHALRPIDPDHPAPLLDEDLEMSLARVADFKVPLPHATLSAAIEFQAPEKGRSGIPFRLVAFVATMAALLAIWYATPVSDLADVQTLEPYFERIAASGWAPLVIPLIFLVASLAFFPVTILIALTGMTLGPFLGLLCASVGCLGGALLSFWVGTLLGERGLRPIMGRKLTRLSTNLADKGILSVAGIRLLPVAPFTVINLIAGASHIRIVDFVVGTIFGMAPGIILMTALGDRLREVWRNPSAENVVVLGLITAGWLGAAFGFQYLISKYRKTG